MFTLLLDQLHTALRHRVTLLRQQRTRDAGYTTETVVLTAILTVLGVSVAGIITAKVLARARGMNLDGE